MGVLGMTVRRETTESPNLTTTWTIRTVNRRPPMASLCLFTARLPARPTSQKIQIGTTAAIRLGTGVITTTTIRTAIEVRRIIVIGVGGGGGGEGEGVVVEVLVTLGAFKKRSSPSLSGLEGRGGKINPGGRIIRPTTTTEAVVVDKLQKARDHHLHHSCKGLPLAGVASTTRGESHRRGIGGALGMLVQFLPSSPRLRRLRPRPRRQPRRQSETGLAGVPLPQLTTMLRLRTRRPQLRLERPLLSPAPS